MLDNMTAGKIININGGWTSKDGKNKINLIQTRDKFEGFVGDKDDVKITLGTISERTLNFKQTWHRGRNKGAVATVYGKLTSDNSTILLEFEGMRSNGKGMKGKNAIYRESLIGTWTPMGLSGSGDIWYFSLKNERDITGYYETKLKERVLLRGQRSQKDVNFFTISLQRKNGRWDVAKIKGEYRCPSIILALREKNVILGRKRQETMPRYEEYDPLPLSQEDSESEMIFCTNETSFSSRKRPFRNESKVMENKNVQPYYSEPTRAPDSHPEDLRTRLLSASWRAENRTRKKCCWCF